MLKSAPILIVVIAGLCSGAFAQSADLPTAPQGFSWKHIDEIKAAFLIPDGWYFKREIQKNTLAYFITQENIDKQGLLETGLTVNVMRRLTAISAHTYARQFIAKLTSENQVLHTWELGTGDLQGYGCQIKIPGSKDRPAIMMHSLAIANIRTNTLYILMFESPENKWPSAWEKGKVIMDMFALDDEI